MSGLSSNTEYGVVNKNTTYQNTQGWGIEVHTYSPASGGDFAVSFYITTQTAWGNTNAAARNSSMTGDTWHHIAGVRDGTTTRLYFDGDLVTTKTHADCDDNVDNGQPVIIGDHSWGPTFPGLIDEARLYASALTEQEIGMLAGEGSVDLSPNTDVNPVNTSHTVTAEIDVDSADVTDPYTVNFEVTSGPNSGDSAEVDTDLAGNVDDADFSYNGDGGGGIDQINAWIDIDLDDQIDSGEPQDAVTKDWFIPVPVSVDIKPTSCPNPLNVKSKGVLPVAILGTEDFDVADIDPSSVEIGFFAPGSDPFDGGVPAERSANEDVATPYEDIVEDCDDCSEEGPDGFLDLTLKFDKQDVIATLGDVEDGDCILLTLTGYLRDGTGFLGSDIVKIIKKEPNGNGVGPAAVSFSNGKGKGPKNK